MTPQRLGPIELDANGEASGEGWRVERLDGGFRLWVGDSRWTELTLKRLAGYITWASERLAAPRGNVAARKGSE